MNEYGDYAEYMGLDYNKPLDEQVYEEDQGTWQHYFLQEAIDVWSYYSALAQKAEDQGILLGDAQQELDNLYEMLESQATLNGFNSVEEMIVADYGPGVTFYDYYDYMKTFFYAQAYYDAAIADLAITEDMVESFYNENLSSYQDMGITKDSGNMYNIRHVLIEVAGSDNAAWETCKSTAETLMNKWILDGATEEDFIDMAIQYSNDSGSSANGGLYQYLNAETNFVPEFVNWYMDENRQIGDYGLIKTDYGYHLMYCSDIVAEWYAMAEMDLLDQVSADIIDDATDAYPICVDYRLIYLSVIDLSAE